MADGDADDEDGGEQYDGEEAVGDPRGPGIKAKKTSNNLCFIYKYEVTHLLVWKVVGITTKKSALVIIDPSQL